MIPKIPTEVKEWKNFRGSSGFNLGLYNGCGRTIQGSGFLSIYMVITTLCPEFFNTT